MASEQQIISVDGGRGTGDGPVIELSSPTSLASVELVHLFDKLRAVRAFVFDVDGILTNNEVLVTEAGELLRTMNVRDGQAIKWAIRAGYPVGIITGGRSEGVKKRLADLGVEEYYSGIAEKLPAFQSFLQRTGKRPLEVCYMGDDMPDLPVLRKVVLAACPADAVPDVLDICDYVSPLRGGGGGGGGGEGEGKFEV
jgi:3-deoxy-D-manno-octulosonate 8-phosphate phosphatase (KDO 8-P phosphatase)